jgi:hypothetical protein
VRLALRHLATPGAALSLTRDRTALDGEIIDERQSRPSAAPRRW